MTTPNRQPSTLVRHARSALSLLLDGAMRNIDNSSPAAGTTTSRDLFRGLIAELEDWTEGTPNSIVGIVLQDWAGNSLSPATIQAIIEDLEATESGFEYPDKVHHLEMFRAIHQSLTGSPSSAIDRAMELVEDLQAQAMTEGLTGDQVKALLARHDLLP